MAHAASKTLKYSQAHMRMSVITQVAYRDLLRQQLRASASESSEHHAGNDQSSGARLADPPRQVHAV